jgi:hypothetical protein
MVNAQETMTFQVEAMDGSTDDMAVPATLIDRLSEGDEPAATVTADVPLMAFAGRAHAFVHHEDGHADADLEAAEEAISDDFGARFGVIYAEPTGHAH